MTSPATAESRRTDIRELAGLVVESDLIAVALSGGGRILFANKAFCTLFDRPDGLTDVPLTDLVIQEHRDRLATASQSVPAVTLDCIASGLRTDGTIFDIELRFGLIAHDGEGLMAIFAQDITERRRTETQLGLLAYSDPLTGLANRAMFADRLRQVALRARRAQQKFALLMLDLDGFKSVNDRYGHDAGDRLLQQTAQRFAACLRDSDTIARLGGDEFVVLLPGLNRPDDATRVADRLIEAARQPVRLGGHEVRSATSIGIAMFPDHARSVDHLIAAADTALYTAKRQGRGRHAWASPANIADASPPPLLWNAAHEIGIHEIDEQHAELASLLNDLVDVLRNGDDHTAIFHRIVRYAEFHFATEERMMAANDYAGSAQHRDAHRRLLDDIRNLGLEGDEVSVSLIVRYLQEWLLRHVDGADRELAKTLLARGVR
jgi:diguanylate cyclase (GGDEF)-like protein/hemerythrin-like metal-binding protein/PAS domain S-box-containing protein